MTEPLLQVVDLSLTLRGEGGPRLVLDRVSFRLDSGEVLGLVGESGSGKTMASLAIIGLLPPSVRVLAGEVRFAGRELLALTEAERREVRGKGIAMIFQSPRASLNPLMRVGDQVARAVRLRQGVNGRAAYRRGVELLSHVGIADAGGRARAYPHHLSGGMAQRVLIAMALACRPQLLIADEPTTGLDVTIQAQIFALIKKVQAESGAALLLITHDLGVVSEVCQRVAVIYAGQIMEVAPVAELFAQPSHPYTQHLLGSLMRVDRPTNLDAIEPLPPTAVDYNIRGCRFANRCPDVRPVCWERRPLPFSISADHSVICHNFTESNP